MVSALEKEQNGLWILNEGRRKIWGRKGRNATSYRPGKKILLAAGLFYLGLIVFGMIAQMIRMGLIESDDAVATADNLIASGVMLQVSFVSDIVSETCLILLGLTCFMIFKKVNNFVALVMLLLVVLSGTFALINMHHVLDAIQLFGGAGTLSPVEANAILAHLNRYEEGTILAQIMGWGPWLVPLGYLGYRSGFFPRTIAVILIVGGIGLTVQGIQYFLMPSMGDLMTPFIAVSVIAELATCGWFLFRGIKGFDGAVEKERRGDPSDVSTMI
jgi:hypothetical protein